MPVKSPPAVEAHVRILYASGLPHQAVARKAGLSRDTVERVLTDAGATPRGMRPWQYLLAEWMAAEYEQGLTLAALAVRYGLRLSTTRKLVRLGGAELRRQGARRILVDEATVRLMRWQYEQHGLSVSAVAARHGVPRCRAYGYLVAAGTRMRAPGGRGRRLT